jgi:drug/metabolite transporter (DMT)-like permease
MSIRSPLTAFWALVAVNIIWGFGFVVVDEAINLMPVSTFNAFRFSLAALVLLPLLFFSKRKKSEQDAYQVSTLLKSGLALGLLLFLGFTLQTQGLLYTSVSNTGFITGLSVPLVPIFGLILFRKKVGMEVWLAAVIATVGLYFLTMGDKMEFNRGDILVAISAMCYALHITFMAKSSARFPVMLMSIIQLAAVGFYSTLYSCFEWLMEMNTQYPPVLAQLSNNKVLAALFYSAVFASAFAYWAQTASQRLIEPHKIALIFALEPIFAHLAAFLILAEHLGLQGWLGAALIISAMLYSELGGKKTIQIQALDQMAAPIETEQVSDPSKF